MILVHRGQNREREKERKTHKHSRYTRAPTQIHAIAAYNGDESCCITNKTATLNNTSNKKNISPVCSFGVLNAKPRYHLSFLRCFFLFFRLSNPIFQQTSISHKSQNDTQFLLLYMLSLDKYAELILIHKFADDVFLASLTLRTSFWFSQKQRNSLSMLLKRKKAKKSVNAYH